MKTEYDVKTDIEQTYNEENYLMRRKKRFFIIGLMITSIVVINLSLISFIMNIATIQNALNEHELLGTLMIVVLSRIGITASISVYIYYTWLRNENIFFGDAKFLFGTFFIFLAFAKAFDIFYYLLYYSFTEAENFLILKLRYLLVVTNLAPMLYFGIYIILFSRHDKNPKYGNAEFLNTRRNQIMLGLLGIMYGAVILAPNADVLPILLPLMVLPSLMTIVYIFYIAFKQRILSDINPIILMVGFFGYFATNISRPLLQILIGSNEGFAIVAEILDIVVFTVILLGFIIKINYRKRMQ